MASKWFSDDKNLITNTKNERYHLLKKLTGVMKNGFSSRQYFKRYQT